MVLRIHKNTKPNLYGKYFLASEADGEETEQEVKPETATRRNVKVVTVKPNNRSKQFADVDIGAEEETPEQDNAATETDAPVTDDNTDFTADDTADNATPETGDAGGDNDQPNTDDAPETGDETDFSNTGEDPNTQDDTGGETGGEDADAPETGDETDFVAAAGDETGTEDDGTTDAGEDAAADQGNADEKAKPGAEYDSTRKYNLFKEYMSLYNACDNYISKLENVLKDDTIQNQIIRTSVNNLRDIKDIIYDYMTIKYPINSYIQSLLFYQKMKVSIQLIFSLLKNSKNNSDTIKH